MSRFKRNRRTDRKAFRRTAVVSRKININPTIFRGGIRL